MKRSIYYAMTEKRDAQGNLVPFGFKYNGRTYRLYKRLESEDAPYYIEFQMHGQRYAPCLNTNQRAVAVINAKLELDKAATEATLRRFGHVLPQAQAKRSYATLGAIEDAYRRLAEGADITPGTVHGNILALRVMVRQGRGEVIKHHPTKAEQRAAAERVRALSSTVLTGALVKAFQRARLASVDGRPECERQSALVSINAYAVGARSIFCADVRTQLTRDAGLHLPDLTGFLEEPLAQPTDQAKVKPSRELLMKTFEASELLWKSDPNAYVAWRLSVYSMRRGDVSRARREWVVQREFDDDADFTKPAVKRWCLEWPMRKGKRLQRVAIPEEDAQLFIQHWEREQSKRAEWERGYLISAALEGNEAKAGAKFRGQAVFNRVNAWMRSLGWTTRKTTHEMRALYARTARAQYAQADAAALRKAGDALGHRDTATTETHYSGEMSLAGENVVIKFPGPSGLAPSAFSHG
jgi:hypothetical protein